ncbi:Demethylmenaquinone methyltransferase [Anaerohalosphaera lusitana]|uniref:Demethylmenaquinone methyltransferase n=1 Tax=Anaerohalosphaera lusitana TaxID=1936003 RepID=A0A1U9NQ15_9BACT|nr:class I SAM-dependent methyltransferase [Anaerohalosphaera lusitana]AQT69606.1 Demethylmenaquinone methyltransferase [Anaerohalosphaera lusitana]
MSVPVYKNPKQALKATDQFYANQAGFQYTEELVTDWTRKFVNIPAKGNVLDLCCGDGIWSRGFQVNNPQLDLYGVDISEGGIEKAKRLLDTDDEHFFVCNVEVELPFSDNFFDLIFARGPGLYNQHSMDRPQTIRVIEQWHNKLSDRGLFYSIFASRPEVMGTYTPMKNVKLPYNRSPRKSDTIDFSGGKYHHTIQSFLTPFWKASNVEVKKYSFFNNLHVLITRKKVD